MSLLISIARTVAAVTLTLLCLFGYVPFGILAFILSFFGLGKPMSFFFHFLGLAWGRGIVFITGCKMSVEGRENVPRQGGVCLVSNHVGVLDIALTLAYTGRPFGFIAKRELLFLPFFNMWIYLLGGLFIDRKNVRRAIKTINGGIKKIRDGNAMLIFPEGTRSMGRGLLPFRSGAMKLATNSLAPIVPVAISGSYDVFEKNYRIDDTVPVRIVFCPPLITADMSPEDRRGKLADHVRSIIEETLSKP